MNRTNNRFSVFSLPNQSKTCYKMAPTLGLTASRWQQYIGTDIKYSGRIQPASLWNSLYQLWFYWHVLWIPSLYHGRDRWVNYLCAHELTLRSKWTTCIVNSLLQYSALQKHFFVIHQLNQYNLQAYWYLQFIILYHMNALICVLKIERSADQYCVYIC